MSPVNQAEGKSQSDKGKTVTEQSKKARTTTMQTTPTEQAPEPPSDVFTTGWWPFPPMTGAGLGRQISVHATQNEKIQKQGKWCFRIHTGAPVHGTRVREKILVSEEENARFVFLLLELVSALILIFRE